VFCSSSLLSRSSLAISAHFFAAFSASLLPHFSLFLPQRAFASETRPNMQREVTRVRDEAEAKAAKARTLLEFVTARDADSGGPLEIDRTVPLSSPLFCSGFSGISWQFSASSR